MSNIFDFFLRCKIQFEKQVLEHHMNTFLKFSDILHAFCAQMIAKIYKDTVQNLDFSKTSLY